MSSRDAWDEWEVLISLFLGLGKIWTSLGLNWLKEIAENEIGCCLSATNATTLVVGRCSARPCFWVVRFCL